MTTQAVTTPTVSDTKHPWIGIIHKIFAISSIAVIIVSTIIFYSDYVSISCFGILSIIIIIFNIKKKSFATSNYVFYIELLAFAAIFYSIIRNIYVLWH